VIKQRFKMLKADTVSKVLQKLARRKHPSGHPVATDEDLAAHLNREVLMSNTKRRLDRRTILAGMTAGVSAGIGAMSAFVPTQAQSQVARRNFVLVHGSWHGGWCWRRVADMLEIRGHKVFTPTLTGLGERSHLMSAMITLDTPYHRCRQCHKMGKPR
jgi:hypothetical protein